MRGPLLFLPSLVHHTQWVLLSHYYRASGCSYSNLSAASESHYCMACLLTINFQNRWLFEDVYYLCWKTFLFPLSHPLSPSLSSSTFSSSLSPACSSSSSYSLSLSSLHHFLPPSHACSLLTAKYSQLSLVPTEAFQAREYLQSHLFCIIQPSCQPSLSPEIGNEACKGRGQSILKK